MSALHDAWEGLSDGTKHFWDAVSVGAVVGWIFSLLPSIATLLTVIWMLFRVIESKVFRAILLSLTGRDIGKWLGAKSDD